MHLSPRQRVLDVGCAAAADMIELARRVALRFALEQINEAFAPLKCGGVARSLLDTNAE